jgi:alginate O-acetyltransferase complex protein AlgI
MLFNSYTFLFCFLPVALLGFALFAALIDRRISIGWLVLCSMVYYGYWSRRYLALLMVSLTFNYLIGTFWLTRQRPLLRRTGLLTGLIFNLLVLAYFKYTHLIVATLAPITGQAVHFGTYSLPFGLWISISPNIVLPLGISFFTFQKIAYLVDTFKGRGYSRNFLHYVLFVLFFPQLIAGPIVHPREILPQLARRSYFGVTSKNLSIGLTLFFFGLAKKVLVADTLAPTATEIFDHVASGDTIGFTTAWLGALTYAVQIYFDFSGYTDMAIGLARLFGIRLPLNFNSPYQADSIVDFWRRWHMTLSRFLRDYLYIPMGGGRRGKFRRYLNLLLTMLLGGLWHGANWTFLVWGGLHGLFLCINHFWSAMTHGRCASLPASRWSRAWKRGVTFAAIVIAWVFFRAQDFRISGHMLAGMCAMHGLHLDEIRRSHLRWPMTLSAIAFCFFAPNTQHLMALVRPALGVLPPPPNQQAGRLLWRPTLPWALVSAALAIASILSLARPSEFIYYQF